MIWKLISELNRTRKLNGSIPVSKLKASKQWTSSLINPIPKKGNPQLMTNYREISLMSMAANVFNRILLNRIPNQAVFRAGLGLCVKTAEESAYKVGLEINIEKAVQVKLNDKSASNPSSTQAIVEDFKCSDLESQYSSWHRMLNGRLCCPSPCTTHEIVRKLHWKCVKAVRDLDLRQTSGQTPTVKHSRQEIKHQRLALNCAKFVKNACVKRWF
ncbi:hypothetical protein HELRODRAFT_162958 [Helobdella robusta]|uniref:Reverse transcriptase domain-containing protein n=1 Tax=Helobdella robusta TaxID=6412 RepID=T1ETF4_HELRO|nr:hypothetical protein HELRODRAFT_162958 [Helobdella robusta]ESN99411.1 hypothetical protein HELRODRAFT_162958 [Helobdella robusta]